MRAEEEDNIIISLCSSDEDSFALPPSPAAEPVRKKRKRKKRDGSQRCVQGPSGAEKSPHPQLTLAKEETPPPPAVEVSRTGAEKSESPVPAMKDGSSKTPGAGPAENGAGSTINCVLCGDQESFPDDGRHRKELRRHIRIQHFPAYAPFQCPTCGCKWGDPHLCTIPGGCCPAFKGTMESCNILGERNFHTEAALLVIYTHSVEAKARGGTEHLVAGMSRLSVKNDSVLPDLKKAARGPSALGGAGSPRQPLAPVDGPDGYKRVDTPNSSTTENHQEAAAPPAQARALGSSEGGAGSPLASPLSLKAHPLPTPDPANMLACKECGAKLKRDHVIDQQLHISNLHGESQENALQRRSEYFPSLPCKFCGEMVSTPERMREHCYDEHLSHPYYFCRSCRKFDGLDMEKAFKAKIYQEVEEHSSSKHKKCMVGRLPDLAEEVQEMKLRIVEFLAEEHKVADQIAELERLRS